jgi:hypothetical protein
MPGNILREIAVPKAGNRASRFNTDRVETAASSASGVVSAAGLGMSGAAYEYQRDEADEPQNNS